MRTRTSNRGMSPLAMFSFAAITLLIGGGATIAALLMTGVISLGDKPPALMAPSHAGLVAVIVPGRQIKAYAKVTADDLADPESGAIVKVRYFTPEEIRPEWITSDLGKIVGRVVRSDKSPGRVFTERDFFPEGTRPGIVAAVPPGLRALTLEAKDFPALAQLSAGDHFDIVATFPVNLSKLPIRTFQGLTGTDVNLNEQRAVDSLFRLNVLSNLDVLGSRGLEALEQREAQRAQENRRFRVIVIVRAGVVITPADAKKPTIVVAIDPNEIAHLADAQQSQATLTAVARSGQPGESRVDWVESDPLAGLVTVETIKNRAIRTEAFVPSHPGAKVLPAGVAADNPSESKTVNN